MTVINLKLELPDDLARRADAAGLLSPEELARLLREEMRRDAIRQLREGAARATATGSIPMAMADIQQEVGAVRRTRRSDQPGVA